MPAESTKIGGTCQHEVWHSAHTAGCWDVASDTFSVNCFSDWHQTQATEVVIASGRHTLCLYPRHVYQDDAMLVSDVQAYLWCRSVGCCPPPGLHSGWELFYGRYRPVVQRTVKKHRHKAARGEDDDLGQEVWHEIVRSLPRLRYEPSWGSVRAWLVGLAKRKLQRLAHTYSRPTYRPSCRRIDDISMPLLSRHPGPAQEMEEREAFSQFESALDQFCGETPHETYQVFFARVFRGARLGEVAVMLGMTPAAARTRLCRAMQGWREMGRRFLA